MPSCEFNDAPSWVRTSFQTVDEIIFATFAVACVQLHLPFCTGIGTRAAFNRHNRVASIKERSVYGYAALIELQRPEALPRLADNGPNAPAAVATQLGLVTLVVNLI